MLLGKIGFRDEMAWMHRLTKQAGCDGICRLLQSAALIIIDNFHVLISILSPITLTL